MTNSATPANSLLATIAHRATLALLAIALAAVAMLVRSWHDARATAEQLQSTLAAQQQTIAAATAREFARDAQAAKTLAQIAAAKQRVKTPAQAAAALASALPPLPLPVDIELPTLSGAATDAARQSASSHAPTDCVQHGTPRDAIRQDTSTAVPKNKNAPGVSAPDAPSQSFTPADASANPATKPQQTTRDTSAAASSSPTESLAAQIREVLQKIVPGRSPAATPCPSAPLDAAQGSAANANTQSAASASAPAHAAERIGDTMRRCRAARIKLPDAVNAEPASSAVNAAPGVAALPGAAVRTVKPAPGLTTLPHAAESAATVNAPERRGTRSHPACRPSVRSHASYSGGRPQASLRPARGLPRLPSEPSAAQSDLADERTKLTATAAERDAALKSAKGGAFWTRLKRGAEWFALGAATGASLAAAISQAQASEKTP